MNFPYRLRYASAFQYHPRLNGEAAGLSRTVRDNVKAGRVDYFGASMMHIINNNPDIFEYFLGENNILVPIPRSAILQPDMMWPSKELAEYLYVRGKGSGISRLIRRSIAVRKAAYCQSEDRPKVSEHIVSLEVVNEILPTSALDNLHFTLIDDVLTQGSTASACAIKLLEKYPNAQIKLFTAIQTKSLSENFTTFDVPQNNEIICYESLKTYVENT